MRLTALDGNQQRLDGGAMFGNVPRALWSRWAVPDGEGRIELACRALLVEDEQRVVLFEAGIGAFFEPALRARYGVSEAGHVLLDSLAKRGLGHEDVDVVVLSHLHFDHAGGLLAPYVQGRPPELLFPRARFVVGRAAFERARSPHARDRASFIPELPGLLEASGRLTLAEPGDAASVLGAGYRFSASHGHTPGMLHTSICGSRGEVFFCADLVPGVPWVHLPVTMGYDRFPERLIDEKAALFPELSSRGAWLFFTHDASTAAAKLTRDARGRYAVQGAIGPDWAVDLGPGLDPEGQAG